MKKNLKIILNISLIFLILLCFMLCCPFKIVKAGDDSTEAEEETEEDEIDAVSNATSSWLANGQAQYTNTYGDDSIDLLDTSLGQFLYTIAILFVAIIDLGLLGFYIMQKVGIGVSEPIGIAKFKNLLLIILVTNAVVVGAPLLVKGVLYFASSLNG